MVNPWGKSRPTPPATATATPTPTTTAPTESFIRKKFSTLRPGVASALATSSTVGASTVGSSSSNNNHLPHSNKQRAARTSRRDHGAIGQEPNPHRVADSAWQTAYSTAKMVVDITKESSDMFLPLKAVVGAISVLIKNYDVSLVPVTIELLCSRPAP
jgi:hypothetical protein